MLFSVIGGSTLCLGAYTVVTGRVGAVVWCSEDEARGGEIVGVESG